MAHVDQGISLTIGALCAIAAFALGLSVVRPTSWRRSRSAGGRGERKTAPPEQGARSRRAEARDSGRAGRPAVLVVAWRDGGGPVPRLELIPSSRPRSPDAELPGSSRIVMSFPRPSGRRPRPSGTEVPRRDPDGRLEGVSVRIRPCREPRRLAAGGRLATTIEARGSRRQDASSVVRTDRPGTRRRAILPHRREQHAPSGRIVASTATTGSSRKPSDPRS